MLDTNPQQVYDFLKQALGVDEQGLEPNEEEDDLGVQGLPPEILARLDRTEKILATLAENHVASQRTAAEQAEDEELESTLKLLSDEYGEFDEEYVLAKVFHGATWDDAIKAYQKLVGPKEQADPVGEPKRQLPKVLSGGGVHPVETQNPADLSRTDVKNFVASVLAQANQG